MKIGLQWSRKLVHGRFVTGLERDLAAFQRTFASRRDDGFAHLGPEGLALGCETRTDPAEYRWDGLRRAADPAHPHVVLQATLDGWGSFERGGRRWRVGPGQAFFTVLPSRHVYRLPEESGRWSFFWFNSGHPWLVERWMRLARRQAPVFALPPGGRLWNASRSLFERVCQRRFEDAFAEEAALLEWMLELERHLHEQAHPRGARERMLGELRDYTLKHLARSFGVEEFARGRGWSRSHFSHRFREATGLAPAAHVLEVRLGEVRRKLRESRAPLKEIAAETGFADANHLCKAFRRQYHQSPGTYRRLIG
jgi:AraC-like DNA-binding protein